MSYLEYGNKTDKCGKRESHMVGTGIWRETLKIEKNDKCTLQDMTYGENTDKRK